MKDSDVLFITNKNGMKTHAVLPIELYSKLIALKGLLKVTAPLGEHELYTFSCQNVSAKGYPFGTRRKPYFYVTKDSQAVLMPVSSVPDHIQQMREELLSDRTLQLDPPNNCFVFTKDYKFQSPSAAAAIIAGTVRNGLDVWLNREGFSLKDSGFGIKVKKRAPDK